MPKPYQLYNKVYPDQPEESKLSFVNNKINKVNQFVEKLYFWKKKWLKNFWKKMETKDKKKTWNFFFKFSFKCFFR